MTDLTKALDTIQQTHAKILSDLDQKWSRKYEKLEAKFDTVQADCMAKAEKKMARKLAAAKKVLGQI